MPGMPLQILVPSGMSGIEHRRASESFKSLIDLGLRTHSRSWAEETIQTVEEGCHLCFRVVRN